MIMNFRRQISDKKKKTLNYLYDKINLLALATLLENRSEGSYQKHLHKTYTY